jgi:hypothetical protein
MIVERVFHNINFGNPLKKLNNLQIGYKDAVSRSFAHIATLRERDIHIDRLEKQLAEERTLNSLNTSVNKETEISQMQ